MGSYHPAAERSRHAAALLGQAVLTAHAEMDYVGDALSGDCARGCWAWRTISAQDNVGIMERAGSMALLVYYDVGNCTRNGFNSMKELRWLGANRVRQIHFKDNPHYLGEGSIDFSAVLKAIADIGFRGFAILGTAALSRLIGNDMAKNLALVRGLTRSA